MEILLLAVIFITVSFAFMISYLSIRDDYYTDDFQKINKNALKVVKDMTK